MATIVTVTYPQPLDHVTSEFTVSGGTTPGIANTIVWVMLRDRDHPNNIAVGSAVTDVQGNWFIPFLVNPDNFTGTVDFYAWADPVNYAIFVDA